MVPLKGIHFKHSDHTRLQLDSESNDVVFFGVTHGVIRFETATGGYKKAQNSVCASFDKYKVERPPRSQIGP